MLKKVVVTAALGAAIVGGGTAALAASGSHDAAAPTSTAAPTSSSPAKTKPAKTAKTAKRKGVRLGRALHGTWVTKDAKTNAVVTHDVIHGTVSSVSPTSITLKAADGVSETYQVTSSTKVRKRSATTGQKAKGAKVAASSISAVKAGDKAIVIGTGTSTLTATHIVDGLKK
jgi:hypothetical protein